MVDSGDWVIVDVRPKTDYEKSTVEGAKHAALFQGMSFANATPKSLLRAAAYAMNGVSPVEPNPAFADDLKAAAGNKGAILVRSTHACRHCIFRSPRVHRPSASTQVFSFGSSVRD